MAVVKFPDRVSGSPGTRSAREARGSKSAITAIDVGSAKVCCLIAEPVLSKHSSLIENTRTEFKVLGFGHQASRGVRAGVVVNVSEAERAIRLAVDAAERMAGFTVAEVYTSVSGGRPQCQTYRGQTRILASDVTGVDAQRALAAAAKQVSPDNRIVLHATPVQFHVDDAHGVKQPLGMFGETLSADLNVVTVEPGALMNLGLAVGRCHLDVRGYVVAPYAGARSVLVDDERALGVTYLEMGGATTGIAAFQGGNLVFADVLPVGGQHITNDIASGLSTPIAHAERLKTLYGAAMPTISDESEYVAVALLGERGLDDVHKVPRSMLTGIIRPRIEEILELVRDRLAGSPVAKLAAGRIVVGGGASQLPGVREVAGRILGGLVRIGMPRSYPGMPEEGRQAAFSVACGLVEQALNPDQHVAMPASPAGGQGTAYLARVGQWIRESF
jgi:cell division protein FtsA